MGDRARAQVGKHGCRLVAARDEHQRVAVESHDGIGDRATRDELGLTRAHRARREREHGRPLERSAQGLACERIAREREQRARDDFLHERRRGQVAAGLLGQHHRIEQSRARTALRPLRARDSARTGSTRERRCAPSGET